jgi:hypothetical protein
MMFPNVKIMSDMRFPLSHLAPNIPTFYGSAYLAEACTKIRLLSTPLISSLLLLPFFIWLGH